MTLEQARGRTRRVQTLDLSRNLLREDRVRDLVAADSARSWRTLRLVSCGMSNEAWRTITMAERLADLASLYVDDRVDATSLALLRERFPSLEVIRSRGAAGA